MSGSERGREKKERRRRKMRRRSCTRESAPPFFFSGKFYLLNSQMLWEKLLKDGGLSVRGESKLCGGKAG